MTGSGMESHVKKRTGRTEKVGGEFGTTAEELFSDYVGNEGVRDVDCGHGVHCRYEDTLLGEAVNDYEDCGEAAG